MMTNFNFDEWVDLYRKDPVAFENKRKEILESLIMGSSERNRPMLRLIQLECDAIRQTTDPLSATIEISRMMVERLNRLKAPITELREILEDTME